MRVKGRISPSACEPTYRPSRRFSVLTRSRTDGFRNYPSGQIAGPAALSPRFSSRTGKPVSGNVTLAKRAEDTCRSFCHGRQVAG